MDKIIFSKIINPFTIELYPTRRANVYCKIEIKETDKGNVLSISGVEGPLPSGNCYGSCGQINSHAHTYHEIKMHRGWDYKKWRKFMHIWYVYHLNDMHSNRIHQEIKGITYENDPKNVCVDCGYKIGSAWTYRELPDNLIEFFKSLPEAKNSPAWV